MPKSNLRGSIPRTGSFDPFLSLEKVLLHLVIVPERVHVDFYLGETLQHAVHIDVHGYPSLGYAKRRSATPGIVAHIGTGARYPSHEWTSGLTEEVIRLQMQDTGRRAVSSEVNESRDRAGAFGKLYRNGKQ